MEMKGAFLREEEDRRVGLRWSRATVHSDNGEEVLIQLNNFIMQQAISEVICMDLGFQLWNSPVTVTILLQEVIAVYPNFLNSTLTMKESARISNALIVFQCMAYHPEARMWLLKANIPYYLYPFFQISTNVMKPLQFSILSLIAALAELVQFDEQYGQDTLLSLLDTQVFPLCLHCIRYGDQPIRKVATLILMKILMQENGIKYCCALPSRCLSVIQVLHQLVDTFASEIPCSQQLKYVVQCYLSLSRVAWAGGVYERVREMVPLQLIENTFHNIIDQKDAEIPKMLNQLVRNLNHRPPQ
ncbi:CCR4-NOT transcription complex subunit 9-like [Solanum pennellii]|uniref:CCR4-NOT transcription complex subunit 9-like n=1 Tax=Solanum pennellii TaxID=28526 RepID=A0ABM1GT13_SOLPN|nr:CCR4-NOT transcription complex subunit 9-like [Solanum pennellii]